MYIIPKMVTLLGVLIVVQFGKSEVNTSEGRYYSGYLPPEENQPEYQIYPYPHGPSYKDEYHSECEKNPMLPLLGKGLNILLLKLGAVGIVKAVLALLFLGFLVKLPLLLLKATFMKSFFFPMLMAPFLLSMFANQMSQTGGSSSPMKPSDATERPGMAAGMVMDMMQMPGMNVMTMPVEDMMMQTGRQLNDNLTSVAWKSLEMFAESDQCAEKISCMIGASSKDSSMETIFTRVLKYLHYSSPPFLRKRLSQLREAFNKGSKTAQCLQEDYECHSPELVLQYGIKKVKIL